MSPRSPRQMPIIEALAGGSCLTTAALSDLTGLPPKEIATSCCKLVTRGWIVRKERGCFELSPEGQRAIAAGEVIKSGPTGPMNLRVPRRPKRKTTRDRIWFAIRMLKKFGLSELEMFAEASRANVARYVGALEAAGYLVRLRSEPGVAPTSNGFVRWLLVRPSGPQTPIYRAKRREVYDPNQREAIACGGAS